MFSCSVKAATFCVSNVAELKNAIATAANNGIDDIIRIVQGTYVGNFFYGTYEENDFNIEGGYSVNCISKEANPSNTVLDGNNIDTTLILDCNGKCNVKLDGLTLQNGSGYNGGGLNVKVDNITLSNNIFSGNTAGNNGGGIYFNRAPDTITLINNIISNNIAGDDGGGFRIFGKSYDIMYTITLVNNIIANNHSNDTGGGFSVNSYSDEIYLINNTIVNNNTGNSGGGFILGGPDYIYIHNNIIWSNEATKEGNDFYIGNDYIEIFNNDFDQSVNGFYLDNPISIDPSNLDNVDPLFIANEDYHLQANSACIDAGNNDAPKLPSTDKEGNARIINGIVDMGAYEYQGGITNPILDIKANASDGPVTLPQGNNLKITVALTPNDFDGQAADWWIQANSPFGLYWYKHPKKWIQSPTPIRAYGGSLFSLSPYSILNISTLPVGQYDFEFSVDDNKDGQFDGTFSDSVAITIE